jgi:pimeloyl-ACP methyl ester carboxylesterase
MDHLGIERAHIHGYSMGGGITGQLLSSSPERFITAGFGGSGISEADPDLRASAEAMDPEAPEPTGAAAAAFQRLRERAASRNQARGDGGSAPPPRPALTFGDAAHAVPVLAVNGEYDRPYSKTQRILREFRTMQNVVLPGLNHMTAIMVGGPMPQAYIDAMVGFIDLYDAR